MSSIDYVKHIEALSKMMTGTISTNEAQLKEYSEDASLFHIMPSLIVSPENTADLQRLVRYATEHNLNLTARSAGTDMTGGPLTKGIVVDFVKFFTQVHAIKQQEGGGGRARVQPGVYYRDFEKQSLAKNLLLPSYTASKDLNTIGGMVANNSAGEKTLTYGQTAKWVREITAVLSDGNEYVFKKLSRIELEHKKIIDGFEGELYTKLEKIITDNHEVLQKAKPDTTKNTAGYALWNVWDKENDTFDLTQLICGSQGTLALLTEMELELVKPQPANVLLVLFLRTRHMQHLGPLVAKVREQKPESFEMYDDHTFMIMLKVLPSLLKRLGGSILTLAKQFIPEVKMVLTGGVPKMVLLAEFTASTIEEAQVMAQEAQKNVAQEYDIAMHVTQTESETKKYWTIRRESFNLLRQHVHGKHTAPFIEDICVRTEKLPEFLPRLYAILDEYKLTYTIAGHIGSGNMHIIPLMDFTRKDFGDVIKELNERVFTLVFEYNGTMSAEHNDGIVRTPYLTEMYGKEVTDIFKKVKDLFDPLGILNPGKKVGGDKNLIQTARKGY